MAWPLTARAQRAGKLPTIGFLGAATSSAWSQWAAAFVQRLRELGWIEGRTVAIEFRWAEGRFERAAEIATEFVELKVDVIVTSGAVLLAAKRATSIIPTVLAIVGDPIGAGFVTNLARPGGNVTGLSFQGAELAGKRLGLLREVVPGLRRLAILAHDDNPGGALELSEVETAARTLGLAFVTAKVRRAEEIAPAFESFKGHVEALYVISDPLLNANQIPIGILALGATLPTMHGFREPVEAGGLMAYGASFPDLFRRAADYVDKILRGANPGDLPIEQPTKYELIINLKTAKALELTIPESFVLRADEVIE